MQVKKRFEFLEHTADAYIAAYGESLEEAFENAALATFEVMTDIGKVKPETGDLVEVEAHDECALLYSWLEELLIKFETTNNIYCRFKISNLEETPAGLKLKAKIWGEPFNPEKHLQKVGVKAVTYHRMEIVRKPMAVTVRFILDI
ncbi:MAG: archease [Candidatus Bathyarchaeota archaeon]|nr:MAG: archease [Candidatus Bathyarchaeota archaeon]